MALQKLDLTGNEPWARTLDKVRTMLAEQYLRLQATAPLDEMLDLTANEPRSRTLSKIETMLGGLYADLLPDEARPRLDKTGNEPWARTLAHVGDHLAALVAAPDPDAGGGLPAPPDGYLYVVTGDGSYVVADGSYVITRIAA